MIKILNNAADITKKFLNMYFLLDIPQTPYKRVTISKIDVFCIKATSNAGDNDNANM